MTPPDKTPEQTWDFPADLAEAAWVLIANAYDGNWDDAPDEWREAAERWRDAYHVALPSEEAPDA